MMMAQQPTAQSAKVELGWGVKLAFGFATLTSTVVATGLGAWINYHFSQQQTETASKKADVRKLEDLIDAFDGVMRVYVVGVNKGKSSAADKEKVTSNVDQQFALLGRLRSFAVNDPQRDSVDAYRRNLILINKELRRSEDINSLMPVARAVSSGIDARIAAIDALRSAVDLPRDKPRPDATEVSKDFGKSDD